MGLYQTPPLAVIQGAGPSYDGWQAIAWMLRPYFAIRRFVREIQSRSTVRDSRHRRWYHQPVYGGGNQVGDGQQPQKPLTRIYAAKISWLTQPGQPLPAYQRAMGHELDQPQCNPPQPHRTAGSNHVGRRPILLADGSVRFVSQNIQHTSTSLDQRIAANAYDRPNNGANYGLYQRLFSVADGYVISVTSKLSPSAVIANSN